MKNPSILVIITCFVLIFSSCSKETEKDEKSDKKEILSFKIIIEDGEYLAQINKTSISRIFPSNIKLDNLVPTISISDKATIKPNSGVAQDFSKGVVYTVTAEDGTIQKFTVSLEKEPLDSENNILFFSFDNLAEGKTYNKKKEDKETGDVIYEYYIPHLSPIKELVSNISISKNATIEPKSGIKLDYSEPVTYKVTAENGSIKKYIVSVNNDLDQVKLIDFSSYSLQSLEPNQVFDIKISPTSVNQDSIKINLIDEKQNIKNLLIESVDIKTGIISVRLPEEFLIAKYKLEVFVEHDNSVISGDFRLYKGTPNAQYVVPYNLENGTVEIQTSLYAPNEIFKMKLNLNVLDNTFNDHKYYLKKGTTKIPLTNHPIWKDSDRFIMPNLEAMGIEGGTDFIFGFEINGKSYEVDFVNMDEEPINIIATAPPNINSVSSTAVIQKNSLTLIGENIFFNVSPGADDFHRFGQNSRIKLILEGTFDSDKEYGILDVYRTITANSNTPTKAVFTIPEYHSTGRFSLIFNNNLNHGSNSDWVDSGFVIEVSQPISTHPTLNVSETTFSKYLSSPQIHIKFDGNIDNIEIESIEVNQNHTDIYIGNFFKNSTSILSGDLADHRNNINKGSQGKIIVKDNGIEYLLYFQINRLVN